MAFSPDVDSLADRLEQSARGAGIPALALAIHHRGELIVEWCFGDRVTIDSLFPSCSSAKPLIALLAMQCVEEGRLELDRPVTDYRPDLAFPPGGDVERVTLRRLLSHTSGLASDPDFAPFFFDDPARALATHVFVEIPTLAAIAPSDAPIYSNPGFNLVGFLTATVSGVPFEQLIRDRLLAPLGMTRTTFDASAPLAREPLITLPTTFAATPPPMPYPAGGAITTARDLARLGMCFLDGGAGMVNRTSLELMQTVHADALSQAPRYYGLGLTIGTSGGRRTLAHGGGGFGCGSQWVLFPEEQLGGVLLFNHPAGYGIDLTALLLDGLDETPSPSTRAIDVFYPGRYERLIPFDPYPRIVTATESRGERHVSLDGEIHRLHRFDESVFRTDDEATTIGFDRAGRYVMVDAAGIGLVSALPYRRA